jgi:hypothetical protein
VNRRAAVQFLHERHPNVIDAPGETVDLEALHLEVFWFQPHVCELMDRRAERSPRPCFATIYRLLVKGDREVRGAVCDHLFQPHLVFHPELEWAKKRMPAFLAEACEKLRELIEEAFGSRRTDGVKER